MKSDVEINVLTPVSCHSACISWYQCFISALGHHWLEAAWWASVQSQSGERDPKLHRNQKLEQQLKTYPCGIIKSIDFSFSGFLPVKCNWMFCKAKPLPLLILGLSIFYHEELFSCITEQRVTVQSSFFVGVAEVSTGLLLPHFPYYKNPA